MTRVLLAVDSVHDGATACDYVREEARPGDELFVVPPDPEDERDVEDAVNVLRVRLAGRSIELVQPDGSPEARVLQAARRVDADTVVLVSGESRGQGPETDSLADRIRGIGPSVVELPGD